MMYQGMLGCDRVCLCLSILDLYQILEEKNSITLALQKISISRILTLKMNLFSKENILTIVKENTKYITNCTPH